MLFLFLQQSTTAVLPANDPAAAAPDPYTIIFAVIFVLVLGGGGYFIWQRARSLGELEADQERQARQFEMQALSEVQSLAPTANPDPAPLAPKPAVSAALAYATPAIAAPPESAATGAAPSTLTVNDIVERLRLWKILESVDGKLATPMPPQGLIVKFTGRLGTGAILPRVEGEAYMAHLGKRFDIVICATPHGEPLVFSRLQERFKENLRM